MRNWRFLITAPAITLICGSLFWFLRPLDWRVILLIICMWVASMLFLLTIIRYKEGRL